MKACTEPLIRWSPMHELVPDVPLRHGHAISIGEYQSCWAVAMSVCSRETETPDLMRGFTDMAFSATLANSRGLVSDEDHKRILNLFSRAGLSMDHHQFDEEILDKGTKAILRTRDGKLRAAVPAPLGKCVFLNDVTTEELFKALHRHKEIMKNYPRRGEGIDAFVDASDTGYTMNQKPVETNGYHAANGHPATNGFHSTNGNTVNGKVVDDDSAKLKNMNVHANGLANGHVGSKIANASAKALGAEGVEALRDVDEHHTNGD